MDLISGSCYSLNIENNKEPTRNDRKEQKILYEYVGSISSIGQYENKSFQNLLPQIWASAIAGLLHIVVGISLAYSAILLPQLDAKDSDLHVTASEASWIASVITIVIPISGMICGFLMDYFGRLNTLKLAVVPAVVGWVLIATAPNVHQVLLGRIITGFASAWGTSPAMVYITEIARADMRGSLISFAPAYTSLGGVVLAYLQGWLLHWRTVAWLCNIYAIIPCLLIMFIPESPAWLVSKSRNQQAEKSLDWLTKYQPQPTDTAQTFAQLQLSYMVRENDDKRTTMSTSTGLEAKIRNLLKATGYKPLLVLLGLFVFQQFSGIYITLFYSIAFFQEVGSNIDPYIASILIGAVRFFMSIVNTYMLKTFHRRTLIMYGSAAMAICMFISGLYTYWIKDGTTTNNWVPIVAILLYVVSSMIGLLSIPWTMTAELFPIEIRGIAHSIVYSSAYLFMFISIQNYNRLKDAFGGVAGLQWFFGVVSLAGLVYAYVLLPETQGVKLSDIQDYFINNNVYIGTIKKGQKSRTHLKSVHNQKLINNNNSV